MSTYEISIPDPYGYLLDLNDALNIGKATDIVLALSRCSVHGISPEATLQEKAKSYIPQALPQFKTEIANWIKAARTLGQRWDEEEDVSEADRILEAMIELRTDAEGLEMILGDSIRDLVKSFDQALRQHEDILATLVGTTWLTHFQKSIPDEIAKNLWWLNLKEAQTNNELFDEEFTQIVFRVQKARQRFPELVGALAADVSDDSHLELVPFVWHSPDGLGEGRLNLPKKATAQEEKQRRPLQIFYEKKPLVQERVRIGPYQELTDDRGRIWVTLEKLRATWNGRLFVGTPEVEWQLETSTDDKNDENPTCS